MHRSVGSITFDLQTKNKWKSMSIRWTYSNWTYHIHCAHYFSQFHLFVERTEDFLLWRFCCCWEVLHEFYKIIQRKVFVLFPNISHRVLKQSKAKLLSIIHSSMCLNISSHKWTQRIRFIRLLLFYLVIKY